MFNLWIVLKDIIMLVHITDKMGLDLMYLKTKWTVLMIKPQTHMCERQGEVK